MAKRNKYTVEEMNLVSYIIHSETEEYYKRVMRRVCEQIPEKSRWVHKRNILELQEEDDLARATQLAADVGVDVEYEISKRFERFVARYKKNQGVREAALQQRVLKLEKELWKYI